MSRWSGHRNLKRILEISNSDFDFLATIKRFDIGVISRDNQVSKEFVDKFRMGWMGETESGSKVEKVER